MVRRRSGLVIEVTDGVGDDYRGNLFYDLAKSDVIRLARAGGRPGRSMESPRWP